MPKKMSASKFTQSYNSRYWVFRYGVGLIWLIILIFLPLTTPDTLSSITSSAQSPSSSSSVHLLKELPELTHQEITQFKNKKAFPPPENPSLAITSEKTINPNSQPFCLPDTERGLVAHLQDGKPLGKRTPLILVHGIQFPVVNSYSATWDKFLERFYNDEELSKSYKPYTFSYETLNICKANNFTITDVGNELGNQITSYFNGKPVVILAHSMGGLVARSFMEEYSTQGQKGETVVLRLITLGTPHHGTPVADVPTLAPLLALVIPSFVTHLKRDYYSETIPPEDVNGWLRALNHYPEGGYEKIIAYAGEDDLVDVVLLPFSGYLFAFGYSSNDGIVPTVSALFDGKSFLLRKAKLFSGCDHFQLPQMECGDLFDNIRIDLIEAKQPGIALSVSHSSLNVVPGTSTTVMCSVSSLGKTKGTVTLSAENLPPGIQLSFAPSQVSVTPKNTVSSTITVRVDLGTVGYFPMNIIAERESVNPVRQPLTISVGSLPSQPIQIGPGSPNPPGSALETTTPTFTWQPIPDATNIGLYIRLINIDGSEGALVFDSEVNQVPISGQATVFTLPGTYALTNGQQYRWNMRAKNSTGWGAFSDRFYFKVNTGAPLSPGVTTTGATNLTYNSATLRGTINPNGQNSSYFFEYGITPSLGQRTTGDYSLGSGNSPLIVSALIANLIPETFYYFRVVATNNTGTSYGNTLPFQTLKSNAQTGFLQVMPETLSFTVDQSSQIATKSLSVSSSGTSGIYWQSRASAQNGSSWLSLSPANGTTPSNITVSVNAAGLAPGTYSGEIIVSGSQVLNSPQVVPVTLSVITTGVPGSLTLINQSPICDMTASGSTPALKLDWTVSNGADSYDVYRNGFVLSAGVRGTTFYDKGLVAGESYTYLVYAKNNYGTTASNSIRVPIPASVCSGNTSLKITNVSPNPVTGSALSQPFTVFGSGFVAGMNVTLRDLRTGEPFPNRPYTLVSGSQITLNPIFTNNTASWTVQAISPGGQSSNQYVFQVVESVTPPGPFTLSHQAPVCDTGSPAIQLNWTASSGASTYDVYRNGSLVKSGVTGLGFYNILGLAAGQSYSYFIQARNGVGTTNSNTITVFIPGNICTGNTPPGSFTLSAQSPVCDTSTVTPVPAVRLNWTVANGAQTYDVSRNGSQLFSGIQGTTYYDKSNLIAGQSYSYVVTARNSVGGTSSNTISVFISSTVCSAVTNPTINSFSPASGAPGTTVTIFGSNFTQLSAVRFNGVHSVNFTALSATQITAVVPTNATTGPIMVTTQAGSATSSALFTVLPPPPVVSILVDPASINFGTVPVGNSQSATITITNPGSSNIALTGSVGTLSNPFSVVSGNGSFSLQPGQSRIVALSFTPQAGGTMNANLVISHNAPGNVTNIPLTGTGQALSVGIQVTPNPVVFPTVPIGEAPMITMTIHNPASSTGNLNGTVGQLSPPFQVCCNTTFGISPGGSFPVYIRFLPTTEGTFQQTLTITHNAPNSPTTIQVTGSTPTVSMFVSSTAANFGNVQVGQSVVQLITVKNNPTSTGTLFGNTIAISGVDNSGNMSYYFLDGNPVNFNLAPNQSNTLQITFSPQVAGPYSATIGLQHNASNLPNPLPITISGNGLAPPTPTISSFTPLGGPVGTAVTIYGTNFTSTTGVKFNGISASYIVQSSSQISTTVPTGATTGRISVTTTYGTATSALTFDVTSSGGAGTWVTNGPFGIGSYVDSVAIHPQNQSLMYAGSVDGGLYRSSNGGSTWTPSNTGLTASRVSAIVIHPSSPTILFAGTATAGVFRSQDSGTTWTPANTGLPSGFYVWSLAISRQSPNTLFAGGYGETNLYRSTDGGNTWSSSNGGLPPNLTAVSVTVHPTNQTMVFCGIAGGGLYRSLDGGNSWSQLTNGFVGTDVRGIAVHPQSPNIVFASSNSQGMFKSVDGGDSWTPSNIGLPSAIYGVVIDQTTPSRLYAFGNGIYRSLDGGGTWTEFNTGLTNFGVSSIAAASSGQLVMAGTAGNGVFTYRY